MRDIKTINIGGTQFEIPIIRRMHKHQFKKLIEDIRALEHSSCIRLLSKEDEIYCETVRCTRCLFYINRCSDGETRKDLALAHLMENRNRLLK